MSAEARLAGAAARRTSNLLDMVAQFGSSIVGRGLYLVLQIILARSLGPEGFGIYAIGWTVAGLVSTLTPVGMPQAVQRYRLGGRRALVSSAMAVTLAVGAAAGIVMALAADPIAVLAFHAPAAAPVIRAFAVSVPLLGVFGVITGALRTGGAMVSSAVIGSLQFAAYLALTLAVFAVRPSAAAAGEMYGVAIAVAMLPACVLLVRHPDEGAAPRLGTLLHFGIVTMFIHSANVLNLWADRVVIGVMADPVQVGIYQVASQLAMVSIFLRTAVNIVFESAVARLAHRGGVPDLTREFASACRMLLHVSGPGLVVLALTAGYWVRLMFGPAYAAAAAPLMLLTVGQILATLAGPSVTALHMSGAERLAMLITVASVVVNFVGNIVLIPPLGSSGAALACAVANVAAGVACLAISVRTGRIALSLRWSGDLLLALTACTAATAAAVLLLGALTLPKAALILVLAYACYGAVVAAFCRAEDELLERARRLLGLQPTRWAAE